MNGGVNLICVIITSKNRSNNANIVHLFARPVVMERLGDKGAVRGNFGFGFSTANCGCGLPTSCSS
jgi:hypothetical protein